MVLKTEAPGAADYFQWDVQNWSKAIAIWQPAVEALGSGLKCLELGAREGGLSLWLAWQGHSVVCSDLGSPALTASPLHSRFGVQSRITYAAIDATGIPNENHFDIIVMKSILGSVGSYGNFERQREAVASMHKALKPGGILLFAENLKGSAMHTIGRRAFTNWGHYWRYLSANEVKELLSPFRESELHTTGVLGTFGRSEKARQWLGKTDHLLFNRSMFRRLHYIGFGIARK